MRLHKGERQEGRELLYTQKAFIYKRIIIYYSRKRSPLPYYQQNPGYFYIFYRIEYTVIIIYLILRKLNRECFFLNFFDKHDIWHFLSGAGLFFAFMSILTIDDNVRFKRTDMLNIF